MKWIDPGQVKHLIQNDIEKGQKSLDFDLLHNLKHKNFHHTSLSFFFYVSVIINIQVYNYFCINNSHEFVILIRDIFVFIYTRYFALNCTIIVPLSFTLLSKEVIFLYRKVTEQKNHKNNNN
jgi:type IV secretory pathway TrbL component